jgi:hypothetical protein
MITVPVGKYCRMCKTTKIVSEFNRDPRRYDGLRRMCKSCQNVLMEALHCFHVERVDPSERKQDRAPEYWFTKEK